MENDSVSIGAKHVDTAAVIREAEETVQRKRDDGTYRNAGLDKVKLTNPLEFKNNEAFLKFYLESLRHTAFVDINDFEIEERRPRFNSCFVRLKQSIWSVLKFYTYRLWSQQNQINGLLLSAIEGIHERNQEQTQKLESRIAELEKNSGTNQSTTSHHHRRVP
jgi:hypothetical protein